MFKRKSYHYICFHFEVSLHNQADTKQSEVLYSHFVSTFWPLCDFDKVRSRLANTLTEPYHIALPFVTARALVAAMAPSPIVETAQGKVKGRRCKTKVSRVSYFSFRKIPYARPPIGELR